MRPPRTALLWILAAIAALPVGCGAASRPRSRFEPEGAVHTPAFGLTEDNADLLWSPDAAGASGGEAFTLARRRLTALHPSYVRLLIDWAALQPRADSPPQLEMEVDGCARRVGPCAAFAGVRDELAAIASQQRAAGGQGEGFAVVIDVFGVPPWAARAPFGCEGSDTAPFSRPLRAQALAGYRALIDSLLALARREGVRLEWWSPWNEPNDPRFISPQRSGCSAASPAISPLVYDELTRAMAAELAAHDGPYRLILGELNDLRVDSPQTTSVASFVAALAPDVLCLASAWSIHAYAARHAGAPTNAVGELEAALDARGGCARGAPIWVTEAGVGAAHPGAARVAGAQDERQGCEVLARQLLGWYADARVKAVFQYSFREDPAFPVGLLSADLSHVYPSYRLWLAWTRARAAGRPPPPSGVCA
jgi:hypothetical protein